MTKTEIITMLLFALAFSSLFVGYTLPMLEDKEINLPYDPNSEWTKIIKNRIGDNDPAVARANVMKAVERWEEVTGNKAVIDLDGK